MNIHQATYYLLLNLTAKVDKMTLDFTKLAADVAAEKTVIESAMSMLIALATALNSLKAQLEAAIANADPAAMAAAQAQIDSLASDVEAHTSTLASAIANTPSV
jgi:hypothetical protein